MVILFLLLTPFSFVKLLKKNYWWGVTVLKNIESAAAILNVRNPPPTPPPPHNYTSKEVDRPPHFEYCSAGPVIRCY